jgi:Ser/Thr protein kinase RdoA (MazF antagonist)
MDAQIIARYNDSILHKAMRRYGIASHQIKLLDSFESFIYEYERGGEGFILRVGHSFRKSEALIQGEVDWINHLARGGVSVARAVPSLSGELVETIDDQQGGQFFATAFVKAKGKQPWLAGWTPSRYENYGRLLGQMHALAVGYQPVPGWRRPEWDESSLQFIEAYLPTSEVLAHRNYLRVMEQIHALPKDDASYGLVHLDAHQNNFFMDADGAITLFDFDDCSYSWFINDIAIVLFYISLDAGELGFPDSASFTHEFLIHFLRGYRQAHALSPAWLKEMPLFLKLRELELYAVVHRDFEINGVEHWSMENFQRIPGFDVNNDGHMWIAGFMHNRKTLIDQDLPFIDYDFASLA